MVYFDSTVIRAHQKAAGAAKKGGTESDQEHVKVLAAHVVVSDHKVCVAPEGHGKALAFTLSPGQAHELPQAHTLLDRLPRLPIYLLCDKGYASYKFRKRLQQYGCIPIIPLQKQQFPFYCPQWAYRNRHWVENLWAKLKAWRTVATHYEKTSSFISVRYIAASVDYLKF